MREVSNEHITIGGTAAKRIMDGDWKRLYDELTGARERDDLSKIFRVQLGLFTESFHLDWIEMRMEEKIGLRQVKKKCGYRHVTMDGWLQVQDIPVEVKHTNEFPSFRDQVRTYAAQLHNYMHVVDRKEIMFSMIGGNSEPEYGIVKSSPAYQTVLTEAIEAFMVHIERRERPDDDVSFGKSTVKHVQEMEICGLIDKDMTGNNKWADLAGTYLETKEAHKKHEVAKKGIKALVLPDYASGSGHGVKIERSKSGSLLFKDVK